MINPRISVVLDFDKTLTEHYMQGPIFKHYKVHEETFWKTVNKKDALDLTKGIASTPDVNYMSLMLQYAQNGTFDGLNNDRLYEFGEEVDLYPGVATFLNHLQHDESVDCYILSTGIRQMIEGCLFANDIKIPRENIFASEFTDLTYAPDITAPHLQSVVKHKHITGIASVVDPSKKMAIIENIAMGIPILKREFKFHEHTTVPEHSYHSPYRYIIYVGDGPTDVAAWRFLKKNGGTTIAVWNPKSTAQFMQVEEIRSRGMVDVTLPADYTTGVGDWIIKKIAHLKYDIEQEMREKRQAILQHPPRFTLNGIDLQ